MAGRRMGPSFLGSVPGASPRVRGGWSGMSGMAGPVRVGARGVGTGRVGVSTGSSWPRPSPTAGRMGCVEAVEEDGTPFESN